MYASEVPHSSIGTLDGIGQFRFGGRGWINDNGRGERELSSGCEVGGVQFGRCRNGGACCEESVEKCKA